MSDVSSGSEYSYSSSDVDSEDDAHSDEEGVFMDFVEIPPALPTRCITEIPSLAENPNWLNQENIERIVFEDRLLTFPDENREFQFRVRTYIDLVRASTLYQHHYPALLVTLIEQTTTATVFTFKPSKTTIWILTVTDDTIVL